MSRQDQTEALQDFFAQALETAGAHCEVADRKNGIPADVLRVVVDDWQFDVKLSNVDVVT